jgi:hypothetical protein
MLNFPPLYAESPPLSRKSHAESPPYCMLNHPPPKPVRFAFKVFLYLFPIARADFLWITCRNFQMREQQERGTPLGFPHLRRLPLPHKDKPPVRLGLLGDTPRTQVHEPQRGKPLASPMHRLRLRLAGGKGVSLALHS